MNKMKPMFAAGALVLLAACATRSAEYREMSRAGEDQRIHLVEVVSQVRSAAYALETIFGPFGLAERSGLNLQSLSLSMEVTHAQGEDGHLAALVSAAEDVRQSADDKVVMTLRPKSPAAGGSGHALAGNYRDYIPCRLPGEPAAEPAVAERMDVALVQASMAAVDAHLCAESRSSEAPLALDGLTVTLTIDALRTDSGGLILQLGSLGLGEEEVESAETVATVEIDFSRRTVD